MYDVLRMPMDMTQVRKYYTKNKQCLLKSLPTCPIFSINKHACISLNMKIDHIMGHGIDLAFYEPNCEHNVGLSALI